MRFALVDIETTGSHAKGHGITEIAIIISDGNKELAALGKPGRPGRADPSSHHAPDRN